MQIYRKEIILGSKVRIVEELTNGEPALGKVDDGEETTDIGSIKEEKTVEKRRPIKMVKNIQEKN